MRKNKTLQRNSSLRVPRLLVLTCWTLMVKGARFQVIWNLWFCSLRQAWYQRACLGMCTPAVSLRFCRLQRAATPVVAWTWRDFWEETETSENRWGVVTFFKKHKSLKILLINCNQGFVVSRFNHDVTSSRLPLQLKHKASWTQHAASPALY